MRNHRRHSSRAYWERARARGRAHEKAVFAAFAHVGTDKPCWFISVQRPTRDEDQRGIDAIIHTKDVGKIYLQIKSSETGKRKFEQSHPHTKHRIVVVIIRDGDTEAEIRKKVYEVITPLHDLYTKLREWQE